jgi:hypothetical protein
MNRAQTFRFRRRLRLKLRQRLQIVQHQLKMPQRLLPTLPKSKLNYAIP